MFLPFVRIEKDKLFAQEMLGVFARTTQAVYTILRDPIIWIAFLPPALIEKSKLFARETLGIFGRALPEKCDILELVLPLTQIFPPVCPYREV